MIKLFTILLTIFTLNIGYAQLRIVTVTTASSLQSALNNALPGDLISMGGFNFTLSAGFIVPPGKSGTALNPVTLLGTNKTVLSSGGVATSFKYGLHLQGIDYWVLKGFVISTASKGLMLDSSNYNVIDGLKVVKSGAEGIHFRRFSSYNLATNCFVDSSGADPSQASNGFAEGVYIGSAYSNWGSYTNGLPDACNYNTVTGVRFGNSIPSENIDIKEGTFYGLISNNTFSGLGVNGANSADSYIDVKGDNYVIKCNVGKNNSSVLLDGFQTHRNTVNSVLYGENNIFIGNLIDMAGSGGSGSSGYAININISGSQGKSNVICSSNIVLNSISGLSNRPITTTCTAVTCYSSPTVDNLPPSVPTGLAATGTTSTGTYLTWNPSTDNVGVISYSIYQNGILVASVTGTSVNITGLSPSTAYIFTVSAVDANGNASVQSSGLNVSTPPFIVLHIQHNEISASSEGGVYLFPNPLTEGNELTIDVRGQMENTEVAVLDIHGKVKFNQIIYGTSKIQCQLKVGVYFVRLTTGNSVMNKVLMVE